MLQEQISLLDGIDAFSISPKHTTHTGGKGEYLHDWYAYLEGYSSEFVRSIHSSYMPESKLILEPFAGVGTTPLVLALNGIESVFCEVNPAMQKVINAKLSVANLAKNEKDRLYFRLLELSDKLPTLLHIESNDTDLDAAYKSAFKTSSFFLEETYNNILKIRKINDKILKEDYLLGLALEISVISKIVQCSKLKRAGDVRYKTEKELKKGIPDIVHSIQKQLIIMANDCKRCPQAKAPAELISSNAKLLPRLENIKADGLITSPPYLNGTNYFRNTKLELWYLREIKNEKSLRQFRDEVVTSGINDVTVNKGKNTHPYIENIVSDLLENAYDKRIPRMVSGYFEEMSIVLKGAAHHLVNGAKACIDIGDSTYAGIHVPTHEILSVIAEDHDFSTLEIVKLRDRKSRDQSSLSQSLIVLEKKTKPRVKQSLKKSEHSSVNTLPKWDVFKSTLPHMALPYSKRNWGNGLNSVCSYQGKMKPALAYHLIMALTSPGDRVLDPFSGSGTIPFEASLNGRIAYGMDIGLLATSVSNAKLMEPSHDKVKQLVENLEDYICNNEPSSQTLTDTIDIKFNKTIPEYFHEKTLIEIMTARDFFIENHDPENPEYALVLSCMLHILHGNRPYALSRNSHPITPYAPTGEYVYKNLIERLLNKINRSLETEKPPSFIEGYCYKGDILKDWPESLRNLDAIITSPPFFDSTKFYMTNWMRYWFCGWSKDDFDTKPKSFLEVIQKKNFDGYDFIFNKCHERLKKDGIAVFHLGSSDKCNMGKSLIPYAEKYFSIEDLFTESVEHCERHGITDQGSVKGHQYLVLRK